MVRPTRNSGITSNENAIIGNTVLYGATAGKLFASGRAGERFCVRNSGAKVVVEGCGSNGCEYMTGGTAVILGSVGDNFGAGMTGGMAFVWDPEEAFLRRANAETLEIVRIQSEYWEGVLSGIIAEHIGQTDSPLAKELLRNWDRELGAFWQVCPTEMLSRLDHPLSDENQAETA